MPVIIGAILVGLIVLITKRGARGEDNEISPEILPPKVRRLPTKVFKSKKKPKERVTDPTILKALADLKRGGATLTQLRNARRLAFFKSYPRTALTLHKHILAIEKREKGK